MSTTTTLPEHYHYCVDCADVWSHAVEECDHNIKLGTGTTYARCPIHEGTDPDHA